MPITRTSARICSRAVSAKRAALARTLMEDRPVILLDEPFSALDARMRAEMQELAGELLTGRTVLLVTHEPAEAARLSHAAWLMHARGLEALDLPQTPPVRDLEDPAFLSAQAALFQAFAGPRSGCPGTRRGGGVMGLAALCRIAPFLRGLAVLAFAIALWQGIVWGTGVPHFILPGPERVWRALISSRTIILDNAWITFAQILTGLVLGATLGVVTALQLAMSPLARLVMRPILVFAQAIPIFALAPILTLWLRLRHGFEDRDGDPDHLFPRRLLLLRRADAYAARMARSGAGDGRLAQPRDLPAARAARAALPRLGLAAGCGLCAIRGGDRGMGGGRRRGSAI